MIPIHGTQNSSLHKKMNDSPDETFTQRLNFLTGLVRVIWPIGLSEPLFDDFHRLDFPKTPVF